MRVKIIGAAGGLSLSPFNVIAGPLRTDPRYWHLHCDKVWQLTPSTLLPNSTDILPIRPCTLSDKVILSLQRYLLTPYPYKVIIQYNASSANSPLCPNKAWHCIPSMLLSSRVHILQGHLCTPARSDIWSLECYCPVESTSQKITPVCWEGLIYCLRKLGLKQQKCPK